MKKLTNYFFVAMALTALVFTSCSDDEDPIGPEITFKAGTGLITGDETINQGETASFSWEAVKGDANLSEFTIRIDNQDVPGFPNDDIDRDEYQDTWDTTLTAAGTYTFAFIVEDRDGLTATETITVTVAESLISVGTVNMGAAGNATLGSYYSVADNVVMLSADARQNPEKIDIVFNSDETDARLYSPHKSSLAELVNENRLTTFEKVSFAFETATTSDLDNVDPTDDELIISDGDVIVFKTDDDTKGVIEVTNLVVASDGSVTVEIKLKN